MSEQVQITDQKASYRGIFKATSLFGGVQVYQILIEIIKSKFIAVLLGPTGVGIQGLYTSGTHMIQQLSSFGLSQSAVRNVAEAYGTNDNVKISRTVIALRRLVWLTGVLGMVVVILLSPVLSKSSFGDNLHIWGFAVLSVTLLLSQINAGQRVILQGTRKYKFLTKCTTYGTTLSLLISVPLYYFWGIQAIVPNMIFTSLTLLLLSFFYARKVPVKSVSLTVKETFLVGKGMLVMGFALCLSQFMSMASSFVLRSCIRMWGSVEEVGLYSAGFLLMTQYSGLVFSAMSTDFYPRLAAVNTDNKQCREIMNQQGVIGLILIAPLLVACIIYIPFVVLILYSEQFLPIETYIVWCSVGMLFKMVSWAVSYVFIAKAESKLYITNEFVYGVYALVLSLFGYYLYGLQGLGLAFLFSYVLYMVQVYIIANIRYNFSFDISIFRIFIRQIFFIILAVLCFFYLTSIWKFIVGTVLLGVSTYFSFKELNKRIEFISYVKNKFQKKNER